MCLLSPGLQDNLALEVGLIPKSVGGGVHPLGGSVLPSPGEREAVAKEAG